MRIKTLLAMLGALCSLITGCSFGPEPGFDPLADGEEIPILRERTGTFSAINRRARLVIHDPGTLAMLPIDVGPVNFDEEMVLLAALGPTACDDYAIRIRRVWRDGMQLRARVEVQCPAADAPRRGTPASPYHLVIVPRSELNVKGFEARVPPDAFGPGGGPDRQR